MNPHYYVCVMAGGSGERFWPMSRQALPKHLLKLLSSCTLLEETVRRVEKIVPLSNTFVLTNHTQLAATRAALPFLPAEQIIAEPAKRDTAPAAALATALVRARDPQAVVALLPADAMIRDRETFARQLAAAFAYAASSEALLTFAVRPTYAATGFGYLQLGGSLADCAHPEDFLHVVQFFEKPDFATAQKYLASGQYGWNAGLFIWSVDAFLKEVVRQQPALAEFIVNWSEHGAATYLAERFPALPKISVDYAVMEKARHVVALRASFDWDDVGTWTALPAHVGIDAEGNSLRGPVAVHASKNNIVVANKRLIALCGVSDLVVVETEDAILVCHRDAVQEIKKLQPLLPSELH